MSFANAGPPILRIPFSKSLMVGRCFAGPTLQKTHSFIGFTGLLHHSNALARKCIRWESPVACGLPLSDFLRESPAIQRQETGDGECETDDADDIHLLSEQEDSSHGAQRIL